MKITTHLPDAVHSLTYVKNSHWIELEDARGNRTKLFDNGLLRYECAVAACRFFCFTASNNGGIPCPMCRTPMVQKWHRLQVCFVPEAESGFAMPQDKADK